MFCSENEHTDNTDNTDPTSEFIACINLPTSIMKKNVLPSSNAECPPVRVACTVNEANSRAEEHSPAEIEIRLPWSCANAGRAAST
jgi:hypothetical protein